MIPYLYAKELKKKYIVYGSFYNIIHQKESLPCRNLLEIYDRSHYAASGFTNTINNLLSSASIQPLPSSQHQGIPDAVFIMMNPGSSKPLQTKTSYIIPNFRRVSNRPYTLITLSPNIIHI